MTTGILENKQLIIKCHVGCGGDWGSPHRQWEEPKGRPGTGEGPGCPFRVCHLAALCAGRGWWSRGQRSALPEGQTLTSVSRPRAMAKMWVRKRCPKPPLLHPRPCLSKEWSILGGTELCDKLIFEKNLTCSVAGLSLIRFAVCISC